MQIPLLEVQNAQLGPSSRKENRLKSRVYRVGTAHAKDEVGLMSHPSQTR
ncbi:hypothetical protein HNR46_001095 [Haloferula luteola]|uniref:Uncharacterized protein n=1 Tax=Haloferula luteola TaxID=595692 RepID=A0A840VDD9_9BACT|nr:hypothetical protein [Haloferula luteola]